MNDSIDNPKEQLDLITSIVRDTRGALDNWSFPFIAWGLSSTAGTILSYLLAGLGKPYLILPLWVILFIGTELVIFLQFARNSNKRVTYASTKVFGALWSAIAAGIAGLWLVSMLSGNPLGFNQGFAGMSVMIAVGYLASGALARYRTMMILGVFWMLGGFACLLVPRLLTPAIVGGMAFLFEFVPGLILYMRERGNSSKAPAGSPTGFGL